MALEVVKPNLTAIQTSFTGRLYSMDMFTLYRAISGRYATYPSIIAGGLGLSVQQDVVTFLGAFGPFGRFHYVGDVYSVVYNDMVERDLAGVPELVDLWPGWRRFTQLLQEDAQAVGEPPRFPTLSYSLPKAAVDSTALGTDALLYAIYRGDVDSLEILLSLLSRYMPETVVTIPFTLKDLEGMFALYAEWIREKFLGEPASVAARVMSKVILLADYRWYLLTGDLLAMVDPVFLEPGFSQGITTLAGFIRSQAEAIRVTG
ncbi:hypothetical protein LCGC14_0554970 [marine sediment metagenome]|uniref:Uncharacterized protein n=1 Tax=marine sediment metagenome TaxID=412755 RepID=A0A0F9S7B6_9ZZZZ